MLLSIRNFPCPLLVRPVVVLAVSVDDHVKDSYAQEICPHVKKRRAQLTVLLHALPPGLLLDDEHLRLAAAEVRRRG